MDILDANSIVYLITFLDTYSFVNFVSVCHYLRQFSNVKDINEPILVSQIPIDCLRKNIFRFRRIIYDMRIYNSFYLPSTLTSLELHPLFNDTIVTLPENITRLVIYKLASDMQLSRDITDQSSEDELIFPKKKINKLEFRDAPFFNKTSWICLEKLYKLRVAGALNIPLGQILKKLKILHLNILDNPDYIKSLDLIELKIDRLIMEHNILDNFSNLTNLTIKQYYGNCILQSLPVTLKKLKIYNGTNYLRMDTLTRLTRLEVCYLLDYNGPPVHFEEFKFLRSLKLVKYAHPIVQLPYLTKLEARNLQYIKGLSSLRKLKIYEKCNLLEINGQIYPHLASLKVHTNYCNFNLLPEGLTMLHMMGNIAKLPKIYHGNMLKTLKIEYYKIHYPIDLCYRSDTLENLEIKYYGRVNCFSLEAPRLTSLKINIPVARFALGVLTNLRHLSLAACNAQQIKMVQNLSKLRELHIECLQKFKIPNVISEKVSHLVLINIDNHILWLPPRLRRLEIYNSYFHNFNHLPSTLGNFIIDNEKTYRYFQNIFKHTSRLVMLEKY